MEQRRRNFREFDDIYRKYGKRFRFPVYLWIIWNFLCVLIIVCGEQGSGT